MTKQEFDALFERCKANCLPSDQGQIQQKLARFTDRQNNPEKQWKITDEDWRNREKWDQYEVAVEEMLEKTSMPHAPWIVVEGNDKYYARIKVLECVTEAIEKRLKEERK